LKQGASPPERFRWWLSSYWLRVLLTAAVTGAAIWAGTVAHSVQVPGRIPVFALCAAPVYRGEVGLACFLIAYVVIQAIGLAVSGRGFVRFGPRGVEPGRVVGRRARWRDGER
jgi:hypothetical protein